MSDIKTRSLTQRNYKGFEISTGSLGLTEWKSNKIDKTLPCLLTHTVAGFEWLQEKPFTI
jgi:hypothetical protein